MKLGVLCIIFIFHAFMTGSNTYAMQAVPDGFTPHKVKKGDTLSKIAPREYWDIIKRINRIDESHLVIGKTILVPTDLEEAEKFLPVPEVLEDAKEFEKAIYVFLDLQYFGAYEKGTLVFWGPISSGGPKKRTPKGNFRVLKKDDKRISKEVPGALMPYSVEFSNRGHILHAQSLPGRPASHGCIRLLMSDAKKIYHWIRKNDPVILTKKVPSNSEPLFLIAF